MKFGLVAAISAGLTLSLFAASDHLRGYGRIESQRREADGVALRSFNFTSPELAARFASKLFDDYELTRGNAVKTVKLNGKELDYLELAGGGALYVLGEQDGKTVTVLVSDDAARARARAARLVPRNPLRRNPGAVPRYLNKWDRHPIGIWMRLKDMERVSHRTGVDNFTRYLAELGVNSQFLSPQWTTTELAVNNNQDRYFRSFLDRNDVNFQRVEWLEHHQDLYNRNPFWTHTANPHLYTLWNYYGERMLAGTPLREVQNANHLAGIRDTLDNPRLLAQLDPDGEIGDTFDGDRFGYRGPMAQREFVRFLKEVRKLDLDAVNRRYGTNYRNWEEVELFDWRTLFGYREPDSQDLAGEWRFRRDEEKRGFLDQWSSPEFDDSGFFRFYYPGEALAYLLPDRRSPVWMRRKVTVDRKRFPEKVYLSVAPLTGSDVQLFVNGQPLPVIAPNFHTALTYGQFDVTDLIGPDQTLTLALRCADGLPVGPIFLTGKKLEEAMPGSDPKLNARFFDNVEFIDWARAQAVAGTLAAIRSVDPDRPIKVHAWGASPWGWKTVAAYGGYSHHTGAGANWFYTEPKAYGLSRDVQHSSEPGGPMRTVQDFKEFWSSLAYMGKSAHDYFMQPQDIVNDPAKRQVFESYLPQIKMMGRVSVTASPLAVIRGTLNTRFADNFAWQPVWRYSPDPTRGGEMVPLLDEVRIREGGLGRFAAILDEGTLNFDAEMCDALRQYVEAGGVLILNSLSGRHDFVNAESQPATALAGARAVFRSTESGPFTVTDIALVPAGSYPAHGRSEYPAGGTADLEPEAGVEVIGRWRDGKAALTRRQLGKGEVYRFGSSIYPEQAVRCLAAKFGPSVYVESAKNCSIYRTSRSNNGMEELLMLRGTGKEQEVTWVFDFEPAGVYDPVTGEEVPARVEGKKATFRFQLEPGGIRYFAVRRPDAAANFDHWFKRQCQIWQGTAPGVKPQAEPFRQLSLADGWSGARASSLNEALKVPAALFQAQELVLNDSPLMPELKGSGPVQVVRRTFRVPAAWRGNELKLLLNGAVYDSKLHGLAGENRVWLNGKLLDSGANLSHRQYEVGELVRDGDNELVIANAGGKGIMPEVLLVRTVKPERAIPLNDGWKAVLNQDQEKELKLPARERSVFWYRELEFPAELADREVWLRTDGNCSAAIVNGRLRYRDQRKAETGWLELNLTPDLRPGQVNRIALVGGNDFSPRDLEAKKIELSIYAPGAWGRPIRADFSKAELAAVAHELGVVKNYPLLQPTAAQRKANDPLTTLAAQAAPLPGKIVDLDLAATPVTDRGPNRVAVKVHGPVESFRDAGGRITGVYLHNPGGGTGATLELERSPELRKLLAGKDLTIRTWVKPMPRNPNDRGSLCCFLSYRFGWSIGGGGSTVFLPSSKSRSLAAGGVTRPWRWQSLSLVCKGRQATLYVDSIPVATQVFDTAFPDSDAPFAIGSNDLKRDFLNGKFGSFVIYDGALTPAQLARLELEERPRYADDALYPENRNFSLGVRDGKVVDTVEFPARVEPNDGVRIEGNKLVFSGEGSGIQVENGSRTGLFWEPFAFHLRFKPVQTGRSMMLFRRHHALCLEILPDGTLQFDANIGRRQWLKLPQKVKFGAWNELVFRYDGKRVISTLNGETAQLDYPGSLAPGSSFPVSFLNDRTHPQYPRWGSFAGEVECLEVYPLPEAMK